MITSLFSNINCEFSYKFLPPAITFQILSRTEYLFRVQTGIRINMHINLERYKFSSVKLLNFGITFQIFESKI